MVLRLVCGAVWLASAAAAATATGCFFLLVQLCVTGLVCCVVLCLVCSAVWLASAAAATTATSSYCLLCNIYS